MRRNADCQSDNANSCKHRTIHEHGRRMFWWVYLHGLFLLLVVVFTVAVVGSTVRNRPFWRDFPKLYAEHLALHLPLSGQPPSAIHRELTTHQRLVGVKATVYSDTDQVVASSTEPPLLHLSAEEKSTLHQEPVTLSRTPWRLASALYVHGKPVGYVVMEYATPDELFILRLFAVVGAILLALAFASAPLARAIVAPLERLTQTARAFGQGELSIRANIRRRDEVGELAMAFDDMADRIEKMVRREKELLANVSHELRTPLARIRFALELAHDGDQDEARRYLKEIGADLGELERLVEDVLTSLRLDLTGNKNGDPPLHLASVTLNELLKESSERFHSTHADRRLELQLCPTPILLNADPILLRRVVDNLLENAIKYADSDKPIVLWSATADTRAIVEVRDEGQGILPEDLPHLFTPFFRADRSRNRDSGGIGLGLALARRVVEAHGGHIEVASVAGIGSTFRFVIPIEHPADI